MIDPALAARETKTSVWQASHSQSPDIQWMLQSYSADRNPCPSLSCRPESASICALAHDS